MQYDPIVTNPGRLSILTALCHESRQDFVTLRTVTQMTDGNLVTHARKLAGAGLVNIEKAVRNGKPVTFFMMTDTGRAALKHHIHHLTESIARPQSTPKPTLACANVEEEIDTFID